MRALVPLRRAVALLMGVLALQLSLWGMVPACVFTMGTAGHGTMSDLGPMAPMPGSAHVATSASAPSASATSDLLPPGPDHPAGPHCPAVPLTSGCVAGACATIPPLPTSVATIGIQAATADRPGPAADLIAVGRDVAPDVPPPKA